MNADPNTLLRLIELQVKALRARDEASGDQNTHEFSKIPMDEIRQEWRTVVGRSKMRLLALLELISLHPSVDECTEVVEYALSSNDNEVRSSLLDLIGFRKLTWTAPQVAEAVLAERDPLTRDFAVRAAGQLRQPETTEALIRLAQRGGRGFALACALMETGDDRAAAHFRRVLAESESEHEREIAAWGLAKLGDKSFVGELGERLCSDPPSFRAAQAIADIYGLEFDWNLICVLRIRDWWKQQRREPEFG